MRDIETQNDPAGVGSAPMSKKDSRFGLASRILILTIVFVMVAEVAVYVPSIANFRNNWLRDRLNSAYIAALVLEAAPADMVPEELTRTLLQNVGATTIVLKMRDTRRLLAMSDMPPQIDERVDLRDPSAWSSISGAFESLGARNGRILNAVGAAPMGGDFIEITIDETPLRMAMFDYSINILKLSLIISLFVATLAMISIHLMVLRPVRRLTSSLMQFGADPEDASRIIKPSGRTHEIGRAEVALADMQTTLVSELNQKKHLAALGLAVAKINHDLRNMLSSAQLLSDRLAELSDPVARRLAPKLVGTLDRAIAFCQSTLAYGRAAERPPQLARVSLRTIAMDAAENVAPSELRKVEIEIRVPEGLRIVADAEHLFRVLTNLCRNAVQALESAGPQPGLPPRVTISARALAEAIVIDVSDTGPGVPDHARERLFRAFQGSTRMGGSGLGLAIAADLVRAHGGTIELLPPEPNPGGATFRVTMPASASARLAS